MPIISGSTPPTPDASSAKKGKLKLAGDLTGTADTPVLTAIISPATIGSGSLIPIITYDAKGRITAATSAAPVATTQRTFTVAFS